MAWFYLLLAAAFEVTWAVLSKYSAGFTKFWPSFWMVVFNIASVFFLVLALRGIALGTAYAIWTGIGAMGTAILGMILFGESREPLRWACILLIGTGIIGLKFLAGQAGK